MRAISEEDPNEIERMAFTHDQVIPSEEDILAYRPTIKHNRTKQNKGSKTYCTFSVFIAAQCVCIIILSVILIQNLYFDKPPTPQYNTPESEKKPKQTQHLTFPEEKTYNQSSPTVIALISAQNQSHSQSAAIIKANKTQDTKKSQEVARPIAKPQVGWPSKGLDYDMSNDFNLWDLSPTLKASLLRRFKSLPLEKKPKKTDNFMEINYDKNQDFAEFSKKYEADIEIIDWSAIKLTPQQSQRMSYDYRFALKERLENLQRLTRKYKAEYMGKTGFIEEAKQITYQHFIQNLEYQTLTGQDFRANPELNKLFERERKYFQIKYKVDEYKTEIHACVIAPTYLNDVDFRYAWHLESVFQQEYSNFRLVIIDDASQDKTSEKIAKHLKWRNFPAQKVILIRSKVHRTALENIYYAVHKYCDYNQIFYIVDGDDELAGTQAFRLYNALYQRQKLYVLYSNYLDYDSKNLSSPLHLGLSQSYPESAKQQSKYRTVKHAYSHLRTMMSDLFLFQRAQSLKDAKGKFYWTIYDNAMYFPALEMSCGRHKYVPEQLYWYTSNTGMNDWRTTKQREYSQVKLHIQNTQKHYHCINTVFIMMQQTLGRAS